MRCGRDAKLPDYRGARARLSRQGAVATYLPHPAACRGVIGYWRLDEAGRLLPRPGGLAARERLDNRAASRPARIAFTYQPTQGAAHTLESRHPLLDRRELRTGERTRVAASRHAL